LTPPMRVPFPPVRRTTDKALTLLE
jgi:hypothetical protein